MAQHHGALGQGLAAVAGLQAGFGEAFAAHLFEPGAGLRLVEAAFGIAAQVAKQAAGFHRGELVLVAEQDQPGMTRQGVEQAGHHFQVDHRGFVHHQHVQRQRIAGVVTEVPAVRATAEQTVQGGDFAGDFLLDRLGHRQRGDLPADGFGQPRRRLAGGRREADAQRLARRQGRLLQQRQQAHHGGGLAGAGAAGDQAEAAPGGQGAGEFLPVDLALAVDHQRLGEQPLQRLR